MPTVCTSTLTTGLCILIYFVPLLQHSWLPPPSPSSLCLFPFPAFSMHSRIFFLIREGGQRFFLLFSISAHSSKVDSVQQRCGAALTLCCTALHQHSHTPPLPSLPTTLPCSSSSKTELEFLGITSLLKREQGWKQQTTWFCRSQAQLDLIFKHHIWCKFWPENEIAFTLDLQGYEISVWELHSRRIPKVQLQVSGK